LPDASYYLDSSSTEDDDDDDDILPLYSTHIQKMFSLLGFPPTQCQDFANRIITLETRSPFASNFPNTTTVNLNP